MLPTDVMMDDDRLALLVLELDDVAVAPRRVLLRASWTGIAAAADASMTHERHDRHFIGMTLLL